jgi:hypothetical protein
MTELLAGSSRLFGPGDSTPESTVHACSGKNRINPADDCYNQEDSKMSRERGKTSEAAPAIDCHLRLVSGTLLAFPIGNKPTETVAAGQGLVRPGAQSAVEASVVRAARARRVGANHSLLYATPHPHLDVSRFEAKYARIPNWLHYGNEFLSDDALAVIPTYPADVPAITSLFLPALGFTGPFTVIPLSAELGTDVAHSRVTVLARRPEAPPPPEHFRRVRGQALCPDTLVEKMLMPVAKQGLHLFAPSRLKKRDPFEDRAVSWHLFCGHSNWAPWDE